MKLSFISVLLVLLVQRVGSEEVCVCCVDKYSGSECLSGGAEECECCCDSETGVEEGSNETIVWTPKSCSVYCEEMNVDLKCEDTKVSANQVLSTDCVAGATPSRAVVVWLVMLSVGAAVIVNLR